MKAIQVKGTNWFLSKIETSPGGLPTELQFTTKFWKAKTYNKYNEAWTDLMHIINDREGFVIHDLKIIDL